MRQNSFSDASSERYHKKTRKEQFLDEMETILSWQALSEATEPFYPKLKGAGRRPVGIERILRIHFRQHWFYLSDQAAEEAQYDSRALRRFLGVNLDRRPVPGVTTIHKFSNLVKKLNLDDYLFHLVNPDLGMSAMRDSRSPIVDASITSAPSSTRNKQRERDSERHQTHKGEQWYFGTKAHVGVDSHTILIHSMIATTANVHDFQMLPELLHGEQPRVGGSFAYTSQKVTMTDCAPRAKDFTRANGSRPQAPADYKCATGRSKSRLKAEVEQQFGIIKQQARFTKVQYRGIERNAHRLFVACVLRGPEMAKTICFRRSQLSLQASCT